MSNHLTVDLASKFSALCVQDERGRVLHQADSRGKSAFAWADEIVLAAERFGVWLVLIEDVPPNSKFTQAMTKAPLRLQGIIARTLGDKNLLDITLFINPSTWQRSFEGVSRGKAEERVEAARLAALALGYSPPDLVAQYTADMQKLGSKVLKKDTNPLAKQMTDYIDAYLMGRWVLRQGQFGDLNKVSGVSPFYI